MRIPSYKIHNVIKVYSRQISEERLNGKVSAAGTARLDGGKKDTIIDRVTADIINKISHFDSSNRPGLTEILENAPDGNEPQAPAGENRFAFTAVDAAGEKITRTLAPADSGFTEGRFGHSAIGAEERKRKS
jgi:hypothetical protein